MQAKTLGILLRAEADGDPRLALVAVGEARRNVELWGRLTGELRDGGIQINQNNTAIVLSAEWVKVIRALTCFPEARAAVVAALETPEAESVA